MVRIVRSLALALARLLALGLFIAALAGGLPAAKALDYPNHVVKIIVSYPAGGATDILARLIGQWLSAPRAAIHHR